MSAVEILSPNAAQIEGFIDAVEGGRVYGWAWDRANPDLRLEIEVRDGARLVVAGVADRARADLEAGKIGDGRHAFELEVGEAEGVRIFARSAASPEAVELQGRAPVDMSVETLTRILESVEAQAAAQRQIANATHSMLRQLLGERAEAGGTELAVLVQGQRDLAKRFEATEVFLLRFDTLLKQFDARLSAERRMADRPARVALAALAAVVAAAGMAALL